MNPTQLMPMPTQRASKASLRSNYPRPKLSSPAPQPQISFHHPHNKHLKSINTSDSRLKTAMINTKILRKKSKLPSQKNFHTSGKKMSASGSSKKAS
jgi:hypothetical protein